MLQRAASNAYSWWWASSIRTKQSKWLDSDLEEMEVRAKSMLKIIEGDGDSFARKAEMYFKKRPELVFFVEETYKAYRALADKYDHISSELHKANHTIATAFPEQIQFGMQDDDNDDNLPKAFTSVGTSKVRKPSVEIPQISLTNKRKDASQAALKKSRLARVTSQNSKGKAQEEIDRLQKGILVLQTEKEFIKSSYESGVAKYWEIEKQITEMQEDVFSLQDEFSATVVIEDDEARALMAATALRSCESSLNKLQEQQKRSVEEARAESERIKTTKEMIMGGTERSDESRGMQEEVLAQEEESLESDSLCEHIEISSDTSVEELAEKINDLVTKVVSFELTASSQTAQIKSLRTEIDVLNRHLRRLDEEKQTLINDSNSLRDRLKQAEEELQRRQDIQVPAQSEKGVIGKSSTVESSAADISVKVMPPKHNDDVNIADSSQEEVASLHNSKAVRVCDEETNETSNHDHSETDSHTKSNLARSQVSEQDVEFSSLQTVDSIQKEPAMQLEKAVYHSDDGSQPKKINSAQAAYDVHQSKEPQLQPGKTVVHSVAVPQLEEDLTDSQVEREEVEISSSQAAENVHPRNESDEASLLDDVTNQEVKISSSPSDEYIYHTKKSRLPEENRFEHSDAQLTEDPEISQVGKYDVKTIPQEVDNISPTKEMKPQFQDQEVSLIWLQSLVDGVEGKEKIILSEYTSILRSFKDTKRKLSEVEKKNQEHLTEITQQLTELKSDNAMKDAEIHSLRKNLRSLQLKSNDHADLPLLRRSTNHLNLEAPAMMVAQFDSSDGSAIGDDINLQYMGARHTSSPIEEKFRRDIDTVLEDNLEFWLRFSSSFQNIQILQTTFEDLQPEIEKLKHRKSGEGSSGKTINSESMLVDKKLRELKTELQVWLEQNMLLQGELESKFAAVNSLQEEISGTLEASLEASLEEAASKFAPYQAAKLQGELLNIQLENNKVGEELKAGLDHIRGVQSEVEKILSRSHGKIKLSHGPPPPASGPPPVPRRSHGDHDKNAPNKNRVPLKSFLFTQKPKKKSMFSRVNPALQKRLGAGRPS